MSQCTTRAGNYNFFTCPSDKCWKITCTNLILPVPDSRTVNNFHPWLTQSSRNLFQVCRTKCPAGLQYSAGHFDPLLDIFLSWWSGNMSGNSCLPCWTFSYIETCRTKCPAMSEPSAGHQQKSAGHVRHVRHISRGLLTVQLQGLGQQLPLFWRSPKKTNKQCHR